MYDYSSEPNYAFTLFYILKQVRNFLNRGKYLYCVPLIRFSEKPCVSYAIAWLVPRYDAAPLICLMIDAA